MLFLFSQDKPNPYLADPDVRLMLEFQKGNKDSFESLMHKYFPRLFNFVYRYVNDKESAEDLVQEVFIRVYKSGAGYRPQSKFQTWIFTIARNLSINLIRRNAVNQRLLDRRPEDSEPKHDADDELHRAIAELPRDLRLPLVMYYFDGHSVKTVAQTLDISTSGVYVKLRTAIRELHEALTAEGDKP